MNSKNIVFTRINTAEVLEEPVPALGESDVLVQLAVSSLSSGTERANLTGSKTISWRRPEDSEAVFPRRLGYSSAGTVLEIGSAVTSVKPGDRVALSWSNYEQFCVMKESNVCPIGDISFENAALFHIATFPLAAIRKCRLEIGESAIVMGMGMLGLMSLQLLKAAGAAPIIAVDPVPEKREKALQFGADYALDPFAPDFAATAKRLTNGGAQVGIEVTGVGAGLNGILDCMACYSRVALLGCTRSSDFSIDYYRKVHGPGITLIGAHTKARPVYESHPGWWIQQDDMQAMVRLTQLGRLNPAALVDETHSPEEAPEIFDRLAREKSFPLVQFDWRMLK